MSLDSSLAGLQDVSPGVWFIQFSVDVVLRQTDTCGTPRSHVWSMCVGRWGEEEGVSASVSFSKVAANQLQDYP